MVLFPTFFDGLAKTISTKKRNGCQNDVGKEAAKAMAKDAQKNLLMLSSTSTINSSKCTKFASVCSKRGNKGVNQDSFVLWEEFGCQGDMTFCGVFDGHGPWGHLVSKMVRKWMPYSLLCTWQESVALRSMNDDARLNSDLNLDLWKHSFLKTYAATDVKLKQHPRIDSFCSGTTALTMVKQGEHLIIANVGDSRAVLATTSNNGSLIPLQLTVDFKPNLPEEAARIEESKGRVFCLQDEPGVFRVWTPDDKAPGLAISRALGDYFVKEFGLISVPDVTERKLTSRDQFVILASDGVWDVISNDEAVQIVSSAVDREKSAKLLVECAAHAWKRKRRGIAMDDMTAICLFFHIPCTQATSEVPKELDAKGFG